MIYRRTIISPLLLLLIIGLGPITTKASGILPIKCQSDSQCEELYRPGSKCMDNGRCSNPYASGCLANHEQTPLKRVCNADDLNNDYCDHPETNYTEIRVHNGDWESPILYSWIIQIFLSEFLQVPVTVGLNPEDTKKASFYSIEGEMSWSSQSYAFEDILTANDNAGRCDLTNDNCVHVMPEVWIGQEKKWKSYLSNGHIDQVNGDGQVGKISWYVPAATAKRFPSVVSYHGMAGERELLAAIFRRPTSWGEYCREVSPTNCTKPDDVAERGPEPGTEESAYFSDGDFTGYFRATEANNCTANPDTCTGHIVGAPCTWSTNVEAQTYHNGIPLESNGPLPENQGYSYSQMIQIWRAANATDSDVVMWWWTPDATTEEFRGTTYEFQQVLLPEPTSTCRDARIAPEDRCDLDPAVRRGSDPAGACDNESNSLQTIIASSLRELSYATPEVDRSPGYQAILNLKVSHLDMNTMLRKWVEGGRTGYSARSAVCEFVVDNQEELKSYIPRGYPRTFQDDTSYDESLLYAAAGMGALAALYVVVIGVLVHWFSDTKVFVYAQVPFVFMVLFGLLLVAVGSIFYALEPEDAVCTSRMWLINVGYTMELVPLLVKVAAINKLMAASKQMRRFKIRIESLFITVASVVLLVVIFLSIWTIVDGPERTYVRYLTDDFEITSIVYCASESSTWSLIMIAWNGLLIVCATVLAFQSRTVQQLFNDSRSLGIMIYSHFVFAVLRAVVFNLDGYSEETENPAIAPSTLSAAASFLLSADVVTAVTIYIAPKLHAARTKQIERPEMFRSSTNFMQDGSDRSWGSQGFFVGDIEGNQVFVKGLGSSVRTRGSFMRNSVSVASRAFGRSPIPQIVPVDSSAKAKRRNSF